MKLDGRHNGMYGAGLGDNGSRTRMTTAATTTASTMADERGSSTSSPPMPPRESCDCDAAGTATTTVATGTLEVSRGHRAMTIATAGPAAVQPKTSAVGSSLFTIDSILAPSRSSDAATAAAAAAARNNVTAATAAAAAAGFFKQPLSFGHLAAAAAASGYAHSTAANFLGKFTVDTISNTRDVYRQTGGDKF